MNKHGMDALEKHLKQWKQVSERLHGQLGPVLEAQKALEKALKSPLEPFLEEQRKLQKAFEGIKLPSYSFPGLTPYTKQIEKYQKSLSGIISPAFEELQRSFRELPPKIQEALLLLAQHGWYLDFNMPLPSLWEIKEAISNGEIDDVESTLVEYFESQLEEIEKSITAQFPNRAHIISSAIKAHRNGDYYLSIPVLLAQTDGICKEVVDQYLFMKKDRKPRTAIYVEQVAADTYKAALLSPLATSTPIGASEHEREEGFNLLRV
jgi:DNA repair exonuclease SbcCD ATPase subunit